MANTAGASAITTRPGPGATKSTTPTARITVPTTVTAIRRSSLAGSFTSASMPSTPPVLPRAAASERDGGEQAGRLSPTPDNPAAEPVGRDDPPAGRGVRPAGPR